MIVGSCRNAEDEERKKSMEDLTKHLSLEQAVEIKANIPYPELIENYRMSTIGLHTMWNEHFGIGVVECMAAGLITVANRFVTLSYWQYSALSNILTQYNFRSGGPLMDIIETSEGSRTGYLAVDAIEYAHAIASILYNSNEENDTIKNAAKWVIWSS